MTVINQQAAAEREFDAEMDRALRTDDHRPQVLDSLGTFCLSEFQKAVEDRRETEDRWLQDLRQYRGIYEPEILAQIGKNRSKSFVKATRVKVKTVDARTTDLLFPSNSERNYVMEETPNPSLDDDTKINIVTALQKELGRDPTQLEIDSAIKKFAKKTADQMAKVIDDQLIESRYKESARKVLHSGHVYGTGVLKAPLVERKTRSKHEYNPKTKKWVHKTETYVVPFVDFVPLWRWYPDMNATELDQCQYVYERHIFTQAELAALARKKSFASEKIKAHILSNPAGLKTINSFDSEIRSMGNRQTGMSLDDGQFEVLERWGWLSGEILRGAGVRVPEERLHETFFSNVWLLPTGEVIKTVLQPIDGVTWPYHLYYCDKDETSIFGNGFPSIMRDDQDMINAGTRMIIDHAAMTAGGMYEVNMALLANNESATDIHPFRVFMRNGAEPGNPAVRPIRIDSGLEEIFPLVAMFRENADDVTAIPRYMQGENATQGAAGTASGMSMLMASASIVMKDLITSYDEGVTRTFIRALYHWNMKFNPDNSIKGDFNVKASGTASLMAKEVRAQQLDSFAAMTANPEDAVYIKREELLRQRADAHDLSNVVKTEEEVKAEQNNDQAKMRAQMAQQMQDIQMKQAALSLEKLQAEVAKTMADVERIRAQAFKVEADTVKTRVDTAYAAMQAGGVATERPEIAPAGDAILHSAGFVDQTPQTTLPQEVQAVPVSEPLPQQAGQDSNPLTPPSALVGVNQGEMAGMETPEIESATQ